MDDREGTALLSPNARELVAVFSGVCRTDDGSMLGLAFPHTSPDAFFSDHGDSVSVIVDEQGFVLALLFAGAGSNTIGNPIATVLQEQTSPCARAGRKTTTNHDVIGHGYGCDMSSDEADCSWSARHSSPS
ncbi:hypothetical protein ACWCXK_31430 [Streptomyces sp. NPDC001739]